MGALEDVSKTVRDHARRLEGLDDLRRELGEIRKLVRTEKRVADDRHETLCLKLDRIYGRLEVLTGNGKNGHA